MKKNHSRTLLSILAVMTLFFVSQEISAQCAMCKGAAEASLKQGGGDPQGLNAGILYMLSVPYLLVGSIGLWWWRNRKVQEKQAAEMMEAGQD